MKIMKIGWYEYLVPEEVSVEGLMAALGSLKKVDRRYRDGHDYYYVQSEGFAEALECREYPAQYVVDETTFELVSTANKLENRVRELEGQLEKLAGKLDEAKEELDSEDTEE